MDKKELKTKLTQLQYSVTQEGGTEPPFDNEYWDNKEPGLYVDIVSGEPLFSSEDKFDSGTGWPSFSKPLDEKILLFSDDYKLRLPRTEVRSKNAKTRVQQLVEEGRATVALPADYKEFSPMDLLMKHIVKKIAADNALKQLMADYALSIDTLKRDIPTE